MGVYKKKFSARVGKLMEGDLLLGMLLTQDCGQSFPLRPSRDRVATWTVISLHVAQASREVLAPTVQGKIVG